VGASFRQFQAVDDDYVQCPTFAQGGMGSGCQEACKVQQPNISRHSCSETTAPVTKNGEDNS